MYKELGSLPGQKKPGVDRVLSLGEDGLNLMPICPLSLLMTAILTIAVLRLFASSRQAEIR